MTSSSLDNSVARIIPGLAVCAAITAGAVMLQAVEIALVGHLYLEDLVLAILLGAGVRTAWTPSERFRPGIDFCGKFLLEVAVSLLGFALSVQTLERAGVALFVGIACTVAVSITVSFVVCRALGLPTRMSILVASGNSICGNSAIAAVAPIIGAKGDDIGASIAFTAVLGVVVVVTLPLLVPLLGLSQSQYGVVAGLTIYAVPQVLAATLPIGALSNQVGTLVKLVRVLLLGPLVIGLSIFAGRLRKDSDMSRTKLSLYHLVPWFIMAFIVFAALRSADLLPAPLLAPAVSGSKWLTTLAMAALGLGVNFSVVARAGWRIATAVTGSLIALCVMSVALIYVLHIS
jgi:uncharacterized integral membrane protein (TIGR00698 family)